MSEFFEPPPRPSVPVPQRYRVPPWVAAPRGTLPGVVPIERVLTQTERVAVCITRLAAYPTGFEFDVVTMADDDAVDLDPFVVHHSRPLTGAADAIPPERLLLGVQFSDGSKATNLGGFHHDRNRPAAPVMHAGGGGGGGGSWRQTHWVWPLPPPGPVAFVCEWPAMEIRLTRIEIDAQAIHDAAARAQVVFSDEHLPDPPDDEGGPSPVVFID